MSVSSVSRTLNGGIYTSAELHARIMRAVKRLGFEPDSAAQALRSRASNTIGCMVADFSNPTTPAWSARPRRNSSAPASC